MSEIPVTTASCDGCGEELNLLATHLRFTLKPVRSVLTATEIPAQGDEEVGGVEYGLGEKSGRGVLLRVHDFKCLSKWSNARKELKPKLQFHHEEGEPYVPDDNRTPEQLVEAGELPKSFLKYHSDASEFRPASALAAREV